MGAIDYLNQRGLQADVAGQRLRVWPASQLTDELRAWIKSHRHQLIEEAANATSERKATVWMVSARGNTFPMIRPGGMTKEEALDATRSRWDDATVTPITNYPSKDIGERPGGSINSFSSGP